MRGRWAGVCSDSVPGRGTAWAETQGKKEQGECWVGNVVTYA